MNYKTPILATSVLVILALGALTARLLTQSQQAPPEDPVALLRTVGLSGIVNVSTLSGSSGDIVGLVSVDRPLDGKVDGLIELFFLVKLREVLSDSTSPGTIRFVDGEFLEISPDQSDRWVLVTPNGIEVSGTRFESQHVIQVDHILFLKAGETPGTGVLTHAQLAGDLAPP